MNLFVISLPTTQTIFLFLFYQRISHFHTETRSGFIIISSFSLFLVEEEEEIKLNYRVSSPRQYHFRPLSATKGAEASL